MVFKRTQSSKMGNPRNATGPGLACAAMLTAFVMCVNGGTLASDVEVLQSFAKSHPNVNQTGSWVGDPCNSSWDGVYCDASSRVSELHITNIRGHIPAILGSLSSLTILDLSRNALTGPIPAELGKLSALTTLDLNFNALTGPIPAELGNLSSLTILYLLGNTLTGPIPAELGKLSSLTTLSLSSNALTGPIPAELGKLPLLTTLYLSSNALTGPIPAELGNLSPLTTLYLSGNALTGPIPAELGKLSSLTMLDLGFNNLTGPIPAELGELLSLTDLSLSSNALTGPIPAEFGKLSNLLFATLDSNRLTGSIPAELENMSSLTWLWLWNNSLTGRIPDGLGNVANLWGDLSQNYLSGAPPGFALARNFNLGLNCFNMNSSHVLEFGQRDAGACAAYYSELTCNCTPPEAVGFDGSCYCVHPLRFAANFTANTSTMNPSRGFSSIIATFSASLLSTMRELAQALDVPHEQVEALDFSSDGNRTITFRFNILPYSGAPQLTPANQEKIRSRADRINKMKTGSVTPGLGGTSLSFVHFDTGPTSLVEERLVFSSPPPVLPLPPLPPSFLPPPLPPSPKYVTGSHRRRSTVPIATLLGALAVMAATLGIAFWWRQRRRTIQPLRLTIEGSRAKQYTLVELRVATNNFDQTRIIGKGGFATVYRAELAGITVAVKRLSEQTAETQDEFVKEVQTIGSIHNRNLLPLRGYCVEGDECLLVYDYMANGSLQHHLFGRGDHAPLEWSQCVSILVGTASGIAYLHEGCSQKIIHRDIKPANILLDVDFVAHVADFGLVRSALIAATHVSTRVAGTLGYLAPEYALTGQLTEKSDVYSFGVLAFVVIGRRPAVSFSEADGFIGIVERAFKHAADGRLLDLVGHPLLDPFVEDQAQRFIAIALLCTQPAWQQRPTMGRVVQMLKGNIGVPAVDFTAMAYYYERVPSFGSSSRGESSTMHEGR